MSDFSFKNIHWRAALRSMRKRFKEDRLGLTASSLTFITVLSLVPLVTVALALFTAFPVFSQVEATLQHWLLVSLVPESISKPVMAAISQFSAKANSMGWAGFTAFTVTVLSLVLTIDRTLNAIWRVRYARSWGQRVIIYWAVLTLGPLLLASTLLATTSVLGLTREWSGVHTLPRWWLDPLTLVLFSAGAASLFKYVPHTYVRWRDAWAGGVFVGLGLELAKKCLGYYLLKVPTYSLIYGAFAAVPILLIWIYVAWMVVLLGAELAAYLPYFWHPQKHRLQSQAWRLELALELLAVLHTARQTAQKGMTASELAERFGLELGQLEEVTDCLRELDWLATLDEADAVIADKRYREPRWVLLVEPDQVPLAPLVEALLFKPKGALAPVWHLANWADTKVTLAQALLSADSASTTRGVEETFQSH